MPSADRAAGIVLLLFAGFVIVQSRALAYWDGHAPGPGFLPFWLGVLLAAASAVVIGRSAAVPGAPPLADRASATRVAVVTGLTAAAVGLSLAIGLVLATGVFMLAALSYLRPGRLRANLVIGTLTPLVVWLLFVRWLGVPLPAGSLGP